jgi:outer membrane protein OmpA-like peptidoglycan-associated protein
MVPPAQHGMEAGGNMQALTSKRHTAALTLVLIAAAAVLPARAADAPDARGQGSKQSDIGAVTGIAIGALAAGPVGAVVGGAAGALIGDRYHRQAQTSAQLTDTLGKSEAERERLTQSVAQLDSSLTAARASAAQLDETLGRTDEVGFDVTFRTDDDAVMAQSMSPLLKLGALVASMPQARVRIDGYADPRGSNAWNDDLSLRRAQSVAAVLAAAGVPRERMVLEAHGKRAKASADGDPDSYALERRVTVRLQLEHSDQVVRRD